MARFHLLKDTIKDNLNLQLQTALCHRRHPMQSLGERKKNFRHRVAYAHAALLRGESSRQFDTCFGMHDGGYVVTALMRRAGKNPALKEAITRLFNPGPRGGWETLTWQETAWRNRHVSDAALANLAARKQIEEEWRWVHVTLPQMKAMRDPANTPFDVIRREGSDVLTERFYAADLRDAADAVRSWTERTVLGAPFLSILAEIEIRTPVGESCRIWPRLEPASPAPRPRRAAAHTV
jgi:hypothetical protein